MGPWEATRHGRSLCDTSNAGCSHKARHVALQTPAASTMTIPWHKLTPREQKVLAVAYALHEKKAIDAVPAADRVVASLQDLDVESKSSDGPLYEAAKYGPGLTVEEFRAWYPVALKIARKDRLQPARRRCRGLPEGVRRIRAEPCGFLLAPPPSTPSKPTKDFELSIRSRHDHRN